MMQTADLENATVWRHHTGSHRAAGESRGPLRGTIGKGPLGQRSLVIRREKIPDAVSRDDPGSADRVRQHTGAT